MRQAEDRAYRLGQQRDVLVLVPLIPGTIDERIWRLLESKQETEQDVVEAVKTAREAGRPSIAFQVERDGARRFIALPLRAA